MSRVWGRFEDSNYLPVKDAVVVATGIARNSMRQPISEVETNRLLVLVFVVVVLVVSNILYSSNALFSFSIFRLEIATSRDGSRPSRFVPRLDHQNDLNASFGSLLGLFSVKVSFLKHLRTVV